MVNYNNSDGGIYYYNHKRVLGLVPSILKFGDKGLHSINNQLEYLYMQMAEQFGIKVAKTHLYQESGVYHIVSQRFDRDDNAKVHMVTASALNQVPINQPFSLMDYSELTAMAYTLSKKSSVIEEVYRRAVFNVVALNHDDHAKNHAFLMDREGKWALSPAYDITFSKHPAGHNTPIDIWKSRLLSDSKPLLELADNIGVNKKSAMSILKECIELFASIEDKLYLAELEKSDVQLQLKALNENINLLSK